MLEIKVVNFANGIVKETKKPLTIEEMDLSIRAYNCLKRAGINTIDDIIHLSYDDISRVRNLGNNSIAEVQTVINSYFDYPLIKWVTFVSYY